MKGLAKRILSKNKFRNQNKLDKKQKFYQKYESVVILE